MSQKKSLQEKIEDHWMKMGKIQQWSGVFAMDSLIDSHDEQMKNRISESQFARKELWGDDSEKKQGKDDDMRQTILGDMQTTNHITNQSSLGKALIGIGLLAASLGGGVASYFIADAIKNRPAPITQNITSPEIEDTDTVIEWSLE